MINGHGVYEGCEGGKYEGGFQNNKPHGRGVYTYV